MKNYVLKLKMDEEIIWSILQFCQKNHISSGYFYGLGAVNQAELAFYDLKKKKYQEKIFNEPMEIGSLSGNIASLDKKLIIHCHAVLGKKDFSTISGHLKSAIVSVTAEIISTPLEQK